VLGASAELLEALLTAYGFTLFDASETTIGLRSPTTDQRFNPWDSPQPPRAHAL